MANVQTSHFTGAGHMVAIQPDEYCFFWINWWATCLTKDVWASWVQALGSLLALAIAIAVPLGMHRRERALQKEEEQATALIVALGVHASIGPVVGTARSVRDMMRGHEPGNGVLNVEQAIQMFDTVAYPSEWQILQIERVSRDAAIVLARGVAFTSQAHKAIGFYRGKNINDAARAHVAKLHPVLNIGVTQLEKAQSLLQPMLTVDGVNAAEAQELIASVGNSAGH